MIYVIAWVLIGLATVKWFNSDKETYLNRNERVAVVVLGPIAWLLMLILAIGQEEES